MLLHGNPTVTSAPDDPPIYGLVRTHWVLGLCVVCRHEQCCGENHRMTCPGCGAQLRFFSRYRDLQAAA